MIRKILSTAATAALISTALCTAGAHAANTSNPATQTEVVAPVTDGKLVSKIMGAAVYDSTADNATKIGNVNDIVLARTGTPSSSLSASADSLAWGKRTWLMISASLNGSTRRAIAG